MDRNVREKEEEDRTGSACQGKETPADCIVCRAEITGSAALKNIPAGNRLEERERHGEVEEKSSSFPLEKTFLKEHLRDFISL